MKLGVMDMILFARFRNAIRLLNKSAVFGCALVFSLLFASSSAHAALLFFNDRTAFELASGLSGITEDFEEANIAPGGVSVTSNPLDEFTNDGVFSTGDIASGFNVASPRDVVVLGAGLLPGITKSVASNFFSDPTILNFSASVTAIGLDIVTNTGNTVNINIFDANNTLLGTTSSSSSSITFWGVISDSDFIGQLVFDSPTGAGEILDNVTFGVASVPEPSTMAILLMGICGLVRYTRKITG